MRIKQQRREKRWNCDSWSASSRWDVERRARLAALSQWFYCWVCYNHQTTVKNDKANTKTACVNKSASEMQTLSMKTASLLISIYTATLPRCAPAPHIILLMRRPIQVKRKHEHKNGQCAPIHVQSTQNGVAWSPAAATNSSCFTQHFEMWLSTQQQAVATAGCITWRPLKLLSPHPPCSSHLLFEVCAWIAHYFVLLKFLFACFF